MKKEIKKMVTVVSTTAVVAMSPTQAFAKDPTPEESALETYVSNNVTGTWYGTWDERDAVLELNEDNTYSLHLDNAKPGDVVFVQGEWYADDLSVSLMESMDKDIVTMSYNNITETLHKTEPNGDDEVFSREKIEDSLEDVSFEGMWKVIDITCNRFSVDTDNIGNMFVSVMGEKMDVDIQRPDGDELELKNITLETDTDLGIASYQMHNELLGYSSSNIIDGILMYVADGHVEMSVKMSGKTLKLTLKKI